MFKQKAASRGSTFILAGLIFILIIALNLPFFPEPALADDTFSCVLKEVDSDPLGDKIPLILIHGIHGRNSGDSYWLSFVNFFHSQASLSDRYKLYKFEYDSDKLSVKDIAQNLVYQVNGRQELNTGSSQNSVRRKIVILAHSMGGLVARSYMQEQGGASRIIKLITLATPHHGSPGANLAGRECIAQPSWVPFMNIADLAAFDYQPDAIFPTLPNRSDLRWDNFDSTMDGFLGNGTPCYDGNAQEVNTWLRSLNGAPQNDSKIIAYVGYVDPDNDLANSDPNRSWLISQCQYENPLSIPIIYGTLIGYASIEDGLHQKLMVGNVLISEGMNNLYRLNDGMVPKESASFSGHSVSARREFVGYDHLDMKNGRLVNGGFPLFESLRTDLQQIYEESLQAPTADNFSYFPSDGLYSWNGTWTLLTKDQPTTMVASGSSLYGYFAGYGIYQWNGTTWTLLTKDQPSTMLASGSTLYADFPAWGVYSWNGATWTKLTGSHPQNMVVSDSTLYAYFLGDGLYSWSGSAWTLLTKVQPQSVVASGSTLYAFFTGDGLYRWNGSWTRLTKDQLTTMVASGATLYADFPGWGVYSWNGTTWTKLTSSHPTKMLASGSLFYAYFAGDGLYSWNGSSWTLLTKDHPQNMIVSGSYLYADFASYGLYAWDGTAWTKLTGVHPVTMAVEGSTGMLTTLWKFVQTGSMGWARFGHTSTLLQNGKVLIAAGVDNNQNYWRPAELYNPATSTFSATGSMGTARGGSRAVLLSNGKVLIAGGHQSNSPTSYTNTAELYDPASGTFSYTGNLNTARGYYGAALLNNGKVLIAGGIGNGSVEFSSVELYDPGTGTFTTIGNMNCIRSWYSTATVLPDGKALIAGGASDSLFADIYDPTTGALTKTGALSALRAGHTATLLPSGKVLIAGGGYNTAEVYDPSLGTFTMTGNMTGERTWHTATLLPDGTVVVAGGTTTTTDGLITAELYDPATGIFKATVNMTERRRLNTASLLSNGKVLIVGGYNGSVAVKSAELFGP